MNEPTTTPAKRLIQLLLTLDNMRPQPNTIYHHFQQAYQTKEVEEVWKKIELSQRLVLQYEQAVANLRYTDMYLRPVRPLRKLFSAAHINDAYSTMRDAISPDLMNTLEFADRELSDIGGEQEISADVITEIKEAVEELERLVLSSDLSKELKQVLTEYVALFRKALSDYEIIGAEAFSDAYAASIGNAYKYWDVLAKPEAQETRTILSKALRGIKTAAVKTGKFILSNPDTTEQIVKSVAGLLGGGS